MLLRLRGFDIEERLEYEKSLKVYRDLYSIADTAEQKGMEKGMKKGMEKGRKEGKEEGRKEAMQEALNKLVASGISLEEAKKILGL